MKTSKEQILKLIDEAYPAAVRLRNDLHMHPELSCEEKETSALIERTLKDLGIETRSGIAGYGVAGTIFGKDRTKAVGIRADIDALPITEAVESPIRSRNPGVMHACGHDIHTAVLLGTAMVLNEIKDELPYSVRLIFQPQEETVGGAEPMIKEGVLSDIDVKEMIGIHVSDSCDSGMLEFCPGVMNASCMDFKVTVLGKTCHGAHPDMGIDTIPCACNMVLAAQTILTRRLSATDSALITVGTFNSGTSENIISGKTELAGTIRALDTSIMNFILKEFRSMLHNIAESYGCTVSVEYGNSFPPLTNDKDLSHKLLAACKDILGENNIRINLVPSMGGDDLAYFFRVLKGCYFKLGCHRPGTADHYGIHSSLFDPDESCIRTGIIAEVFSILKIMEE